MWYLKIGYEVINERGLMRFGFLVYLISVGSKLKEGSQKLGQTQWVNPNRGG